MLFRSRVVDFTAGDLDADGKTGGTTPVRLRGNTVADLDFKTTRLEAGGRLAIALADPAAAPGAAYCSVLLGFYNSALAACSLACAKPCGAAPFAP